MKIFLSEDNIEIAVLKEIGAQALPWKTPNCYSADADDLNDKSYQISFDPRRN